MMARSTDAGYRGPEMLVDAVIEVHGLIMGRCGTIPEPEPSCSQAVGAESWLLDGGIASHRFA